ncbi:MAG: DUF4147 domain-containing protein [Acidobacteriota bacterium]|nr:MAG: DUF4147 domain-containing protein [Acidobacteriota bacterium]
MNSGAADLRSIARDIFDRTLAAIDVETVVAGCLRLDGERLMIDDEVCDLSDYRRLVVLSIGKAGVAMARAAEKLLGDRITGGLVVTNAVTGEAPAGLPVMIGGHPLPNADSIEAARRALDLLRRNDGAGTLVLFLISGGGSAIFEAPVDESLTLEDLQAVNRALVECGAVISEMNVIRRHLSAVKGGRLAEAAPRSRQISLIISDVNSDDLTSVASGPTLPDASTLDDFRRLIDRHYLLEKFPPAVVRLIESLPPMPRPTGTSQRSHHLLMDNRRALLEAARIAEESHGLHVTIADDLVEEDVEEMAREHIRRIRALSDEHWDRTVCLLSGGEAICPVRGSGRGGRNQEFVLRAAIHLEGEMSHRIAVLSAGTDGIDGKSPAAGALADESTVRRALELGLSPEAYLLESDSFTFFDALGDAILTGPTGNNVRDIRLIVSKKVESRK